MTSSPSVYLAIVDDKKHIRNSLKLRLSGVSGIEILFCATNGIDFLEKVKESNELPTHVIMDIEMPELDGISTIERAVSVYPKMKFFVFTVFPDDENLIAAIQAGASGYLLKEESTENIIKALLEDDGGSPLSPIMAHKALKLLKTVKAEAKVSHSAAESVLTEREQETLKYLVDGLNYKEIAEQMFVSPTTVRTHIQNIYSKLHVNSKAAAIKLAITKRWFN